MIKVFFKGETLCPTTKLEMYDSINRIPFSISFGEYSTSRSTIYCRNINCKNFIEFIFDFKSTRLYEISLVSFDNDSILNRNEHLNTSNEKVFSCYFLKEKSTLDNKFPVIIYKYINSIKIELVFPESISIATYCIAENCYLEVDENGYLKSIILSGLNENSVRNILGQ
jgi:hypothetical protein